MPGKFCRNVGISCRVNRQILPGADSKTGASVQKSQQNQQALSN
jgi:hypothetical protein